MIMIKMIMIRIIMIKITMIKIIMTKMIKMATIKMTKVTFRMKTMEVILKRILTKGPHNQLLSIASNRTYYYINRSQRHLLTAFENNRLGGPIDLLHTSFSIVVTTMLSREYILPFL